MSKRSVFLTLFTFFLWATRSEARDIAIIVHHDLNIESLSLEDVRKIYLGGTQFIEEKRLKPVDQNESEEIRPIFLQEVLRMSKSDYTKFWLHLVLQGGSNVPILRENSAAVVETIRRLKGAIGYVWADEALEVKGMKVALIIDRKPKKQKLGAVHLMKKQSGHRTASLCTGAVGHSLPVNFLLRAAGSRFEDLMRLRIPRPVHSSFSRRVSLLPCGASSR